MKTWSAASHQNTVVDSFEAGAVCGRALRDGAQGPIRGVMLCFSLLHEVGELVRGLREVLGRDVPLVGTSTQGVVGRDVYEEEGFFCGAIAWVGELEIAVECLRDVADGTFEKGARAGQSAARLGSSERRISVVFYDPLSGVNARTLIRGFDSTAAGGALVGAAAAGPFGPMIETSTVWGDEVLRGAAVFMTVSGAFTPLCITSTGTLPSGEVMRVTRARGNRILELDGRPAVDLWGGGFGVGGVVNAAEGSWAVGIDRGGSEDDRWTVLAPFSIGQEGEAIVLPIDVPVGTDLVLHQRSPEIIYERTRAMVDRLNARKGQLEAGALLGFECGARTFPFLGVEGAALENQIVQGLLDEKTGWFGCIAWGEVAPHGPANDFFNYAYPLALLCHDSA